MAMDAGRRRLLLAGGTVGIGFGAIIDVVLFHLLFQTHHLVSSVYDPTTLEGVRTNLRFDALFLLLMIAITAIGLGGLWRLINGTSERFSTRALLGAIVVGMSVFNVFDGVVSHYVLDLHNVVHGTEVWNPHWPGVSLLLLVGGYLLIRSADGRHG